MRHRPELDGLRGVAVLIVLVSHTRLAGFAVEGGFAGVTLFFVLSGFLITSLLLLEVSSRGGIAFGRFYLRRARRLLPALFFMLAGTGVLVLLFARDAAAQFRTDVLAALTYTSNWWYIVDERSYFESVGRPPLLQHLWSLGVEEQFYLVWPIVLLLLHRRWGRRGVLWGALVGVVGSTALMAGLAAAGDIPAAGDAARLYFGSDTHAMSVLVGAALACVLRPSTLSPVLARGADALLWTGGMAGVVALTWVFLNVGEDSTFLYRGGFLVVSLLTAGVVAVAAHPGASFGRVVGASPMRWLGTRSYGIYLWHWPVFLLLRPGVDLPYEGIAADATALVVTGLVAEVSYRWVETPVRDGRLTALWRNAWQRGTRGTAVVAAALTAAALAVFGAGAALAAIPEVTAADYVGGIESIGAGALPTASPAAAPAPDPHTPPVAAPAPAPAPLLSQLPITVVGDSVLLGAHTVIAQLMPQAGVDAAISRQAADIYARVLEHKAAGSLQPVVVIHLGTNGFIKQPELRGLFQQLTDRTRVVIVNTRVPRAWQDGSNSNISAVAAEFPANVRVADWYTTSAGHPEYFVADGVHLTAPGMQAYAAVIQQALDS